MSYFITIEGIEGAGKSTAIKTVHEVLFQAKIDTILTREPGGTPMAEAIRQLLLAPNNQESVSTDTELLLMFASRAQHLAEVIRPALKNNQTVLCDRFTDATYAYQGGGREMPVDKIAQLESLVHGDLAPDLTILLDVPAAIGMDRVKRRGQGKDRIEQEEIEFFERVRACYLSLAEKHSQRFVMIDAQRPLLEVKSSLQQAMMKFLS